MPTIASLEESAGVAEKQQTGEFIENTEWHKIVVFGKQAEIVEKYTQKGSLIYIEGKIKNKKWKDQNNQERSTTEIIATEIQLIGGANKRVNSSNILDTSIPVNTKINSTTTQDIDKKDDVFEEEIPF